MSTHTPRKWTYNYTDHVKDEEEIPYAVPNSYYPLNHLGSLEMPIEISDDEAVVKMEPVEFTEMSRYQATGTGFELPGRNPVNQTASFAAQDIPSLGSNFTSAGHSITSAGPNITSTGVEHRATSSPLITFHGLPPFARFRGYGLLEEIVIQIIRNHLTHLALTVHLVKAVTQLTLDKLDQLFPMYRESCRMKGALPASAWMSKTLVLCESRLNSSSPALNEIPYYGNRDLRPHVKSCIDSLTWDEFAVKGFDALAQQPSRLDISVQGPPPIKHRLEEDETEEVHRSKRRMLNEALNHFRPAEEVETCRAAVSAPDTPGIDAADTPDPDTTAVDTLESTAEIDKSVMDVNQTTSGLFKEAVASTTHTDAADELIDTTIEAADEAYSTLAIVSSCSSQEEAGKSDVDSFMDFAIPADTSVFSEYDIPPPILDTPSSAIEQVTELLQTPLPAAGTENLEFWLCLLPILTVTYTAMLY